MCAKHMLVSSNFCPTREDTLHDIAMPWQAFSVTFKGIKTAVKNKRKKQCLKNKPKKQYLRKQTNKQIPNIIM